MANLACPYCGAKANTSRALGQHKRHCDKRPGAKAKEILAKTTKARPLTDKQRKLFELVASGNSHEKLLYDLQLMQRLLLSDRLNYGSKVEASIEILNSILAD